MIKLLANTYFIIKKYKNVPKEDNIHFTLKTRFHLLLEFLQSNITKRNSMETNNNKNKKNCKKCVRSYNEELR